MTETWGFRPEGGEEGEKDDVGGDEIKMGQEDQKVEEIHLF